MYIPPRSISGATHANLLAASNFPHMHQCRWDLARIRTGNHQRVSVILRSEITYVYPGTVA